MLEEYREYELEAMMQVKHWYNRNCVSVSCILEGEQSCVCHRCVYLLLHLSSYHISAPMESISQEAVSGSLPEDAPIPALEALSIVIDYGRAARARDKQVEATKKTSLAGAPARPAVGLGASSEVSAALSTSSTVSRPTDRRQNHSVAELEGLQLRYQPTWLLTMIGGGEAMDSYCQVNIILLKL